MKTTLFYNADSVKEKARCGSNEPLISCDVDRGLLLLSGLLVGLGISLFLGLRRRLLVRLGILRGCLVLRLVRLRRQVRPAIAAILEEFANFIERLFGRPGPGATFTLEVAVAQADSNRCFLKTDGLGYVLDRVLRCCFLRHFLLL